MFIVLYKWRIKPQFEQQFITAWTEITSFYRETFGSLGSRLHRGDDNLFYGYAQWQSAEQRAEAFRIIPNLPARANMREAIEETLPEVILEPLVDFLTK